MFKASVVAAFIVYAASGVVAQQPVYAQCGGINWNGMTFCARRGCVAERVAVRRKDLRFWHELHSNQRYVGSTVS